MKLWHIKRLWMYPFMQTRFGENAYEWLTAVVLGTQQGMSRKWCYWFREHLVLCRRYARATFPHKKLWLFQPGWSLAPVVLSALVTGTGPLITEERRHLAKRYVPTALQAVAKVATDAGHAAGVRDFNTLLLDTLRGFNSPMKVLEACGAQYAIGKLASLDAIPAGSVDVCMSMGRLEHFTEEELKLLFAQMHRILPPGGIGTHIIDHRDHFRLFDASLHCFHHLTFSDEQWAIIAKGRKLFRNRLLEPDYVRLFQDSGFQVLATVHQLHCHDADGIDTSTLWGPFARLTAVDLQASVSHLVVRRL